MRLKVGKTALYAALHSASATNPDMSCNRFLKTTLPPEGAQDASMVTPRRSQSMTA